MRTPPLTIDAVRNKIAELVGKNIQMRVCRGRKQVKRYNGVVENTFTSVFVVRLEDAGVTNQHTLSYSYSDVVCGEVQICAAAE